MENFIEIQLFSLFYILAKRKKDASQQILKNLNFENIQKGIEDLSACMKYKPISLQIGIDVFNVVGVGGAVGVKTP